MTRSEIERWIRGRVAKNESKRRCNGLEQLAKTLTWRQLPTLGKQRKEKTMTHRNISFLVEKEEMGSCRIEFIALQ